MRVQQQHPRVQNGPVAKRQIRSKASAVSKAFGAAKSPNRGSRSSSNRGSSRRSNRAGSHHQDRAQRGSKIMWMMVITGTFLAAGFIFALRSHINTYKLGQAEEELRARLDEYADHQRYLMVDQQRALSATESDRVSKQAGLSQLKLNQPDELRNLAPPPAPVDKKPSMTQKISSGQKASFAQKAALTQKVSSAQKVSSPGRLIQASQRHQPVRLIQTSQRRQPVSQAAKTKRGANNQRQIARSQQRR